MTRITAITTMLLLAGAGAQAQSVEGASAGFGVSTFGLYGSASYEVMPKLRLRGILAGIPDFSYEVDEEDAGTAISLDGSYGGIAALADYHPYDGNFRVSGGLFFSNSNLDGNARDFEFDGETFPASTGRLTVEAANPVAPMLAVGYVAGGERGWGFESEFGLIGIGGLDVMLEADSGDAQMNRKFQRNIDDAEADLQEMGDMLVVYPWLSLGVSYRF